MRKLVSFMHVSLDGFVGGPQGEMDWIIVNEDMFSLAGEQTDRSDTALYGRLTYQMMNSYWPTAADKPNASKHDKQHSEWYNKVAKVVLSKTMKGATLHNTTVISDNVTSEITRLKEMPGKEIVIFGSPSASHSLMADDLIDDFWLFINPVLLGQGIPLFKGLKNRKKLKLVTSQTFASGVVCVHYERG